MFTYTGITDAQIKGLFAGTTGEIDYNSSNGAFSILSTVAKDVTDFSPGLTAPTVAGSDNSTNVGQLHGYKLMHQVHLLILVLLVD